MTIPLEEVVNLYFTKKESILEIAEKFNTYPNKIIRLLRKNGYTIRSRSESQQVALEKGRSEHPTKGKSLSEETKKRISESIAKIWATMDSDELEARREIGRQSWERMTPDEREELRKSAHKAIRESTVKGSALERHLLGELMLAGHTIEFHKKGLLTTNLEVDIYIVDAGIAVEVDGPSHFLPIWGEEALQKQQEADSLKFGVLLAHKIRLIRVQNKRRSCSQAVKRLAAEKLFAAMEMMKKDRDILRCDIDLNTGEINVY